MGRLRQDVTQVIHCAASVDFDLALPLACESNITASLEVLALALAYCVCRCAPPPTPRFQPLAGTAFSCKYCHSIATCKAAVVLQAAHLTSVAHDLLSESGSENANSQGNSLASSEIATDHAIAGSAAARKSSVSMPEQHPSTNSIPDFHKGCAKSSMPSASRTEAQSRKELENPWQTTDCCCKLT